MALALAPVAERRRVGDNRPPRKHGDHLDLDHLRRIEPPRTTAKLTAKASESTIGDLPDFDSFAIHHSLRRSSHAMTTDAPAHSEALEKLAELIAELRVAMLTTVATDGTLRSRPMATLDYDARDGSLWFFTADDSPKIEEIQGERQVGLAYASPEKQRYVSVSGRAWFLRDRARIAELWTPLAKMWFPQGVDDPRLVLLRVEIEAAEYWDSPSSRMVRLAGLAKARLTGQPPQDLGEHVKLAPPLTTRP